MAHWIFIHVTKPRPAHCLARAFGNELFADGMRLVRAGKLSDRPSAKWLMAPERLLEIIQGVQ